MTPLPDETIPREGHTGTTSTSQGVSWDSAAAKSSYANVCNVVSTREEVVLNFGLNQIWARNRENVKIELINRIIMTPPAAKRLRDMLNKLIEQYESRYGELGTD